MSDGPWIDTIDGVMWTYPEGTGMFKPSVRNDALWHAKFAERTGFVALAHMWREAAIADGWSARPTYERECLSQAWTLERSGYKILGISRPGGDKSLPDGHVSIWGPDRLAIKPPLIYDMVAIRQNAETCSRCGTHPVPTERVGFAGRYCAACAPAARRSIETPGWTE